MRAPLERLRDWRGARRYARTGGKAPTPSPERTALLEHLALGAPLEPGSMAEMNHRIARFVGGAKCPTCDAERGTLGPRCGPA